MVSDKKSKEIEEREYSGTKEFRLKETLKKKKQSVSFLQKVSR